MFKVTHEKYLEESIWESATTGRAEYIEVWKYVNTEKCAADNYRHGFLNDWEIKDWLDQSGAYAALNPPKDAVLEGGIRLL